MFKRFNKKRLLKGEFGTTALPDIIFMLLFFFMVTTVVREEEPKLEVQQPTAQNADQFDEFDLSSTLWLGYAPNSNMPRVQYEDQLIELEDVGSKIATKRADLPEALMGKFTTIIKADQDLPMELITQVKQELRKVNALKIDYAVVEG